MPHYLMLPTYHTHQISAGPLFLPLFTFRFWLRCDWNQQALIFHPSTPSPDQVLSLNPNCLCLSITHQIISTRNHWRWLSGSPSNPHTPGHWQVHSRDANGAPGMNRSIPSQSKIYSKIISPLMTVSCCFSRTLTSWGQSFISSHIPCIALAKMEMLKSNGPKVFSNLHFCHFISDRNNNKNKTLATTVKLIAYERQSSGYFLSVCLLPILSKSY